MNTNVLFFSNGNTAVLDDDGHQLIDLQQPWILTFVEFLESKGISPEDCEFHMPNNRYRAKLFRTSEGHWNWRIVP